MIKKIKVKIIQEAEPGKDLVISEVDGVTRFEWMDACPLPHVVDADE